MEVHFEIIEDYRQKIGFIRTVRRTALMVSIQFAPAEIEQITKMKLHEFIVGKATIHEKDHFGQRLFDGREMPIQLQSLLKKPIAFCYDSVIEARHAMAAIEQNLRVLKNNMAASLLPSTKRFRL